MTKNLDFDDEPSTSGGMEDAIFGLWNGESGPNLAKVLGEVLDLEYALSGTLFPGTGPELRWWFPTSEIIWKSLPLLNPGAVFLQWNCSSLLGNHQKMGEEPFRLKFFPKIIRLSEFSCFTI